ncbi:MAG: FAD-binding oxidoreductase [Alphaproteobacteria bacterium]|nr:FAD-binding oxidoreductase [Alphaproteobacteria bacterium]MBU1514745.1 FAD-binding oxidoreductase [Alphaproteobacteria bacterium]MBU2093876.1 FAD-binding oxidoreductase [Alphaproteobacteria bacterium]MBU2153303.1 FAD-binding oxidoreductase [Alphaproteobacteria bacterium]MBU2309731.1 FAD-binding oxidoreductase [Alphaproteobacteria bacterium]
MSKAPRVTVVGAGVLGLTTALALADCGCDVTVCDPGGPNASSIAAGMIAPAFEAVLDESARPHLDLLMLARDLWPGLAQRAGIVLDRSGALAVGDETWLETVAAGFAALQIRPMSIGGDAARGLAPGLSEAFDEALLSREDWRVDAPTALSALTSAATAAGVTFQRRIVRERGDADVLVIATGAKEGLEAVAPELSHLSPIKGHIVRVAAQSAGATVRGEGVYAAPGSGLAFGATMEAGRSDVGIEDDKAMPLLAAGLRLFPGLRGAPVQMAAGVRATTPDGLPMVGASAAPGVLLAVGARRNGWLVAPLVATMVAACVTGRDAGPYAAALDPARFGA